MMAATTTTTTMPTNTSQIAMDQRAGTRDDCSAQSGAQSGLPGAGRAEALDEMGEIGFNPGWPNYATTTTTTTPNGAESQLGERRQQQASPPNGRRIARARRPADGRLPCDPVRTIGTGDRPPAEPISSKWQRQHWWW